ncbi:MAG: hypothetical protein WBV94_24235 [Blastocatellia bacterium]
MNIRTRCFTSFTLLLLVCFAFACNLDQTEEANKIIDAGNAAVTEGNKLLTEANSKNDKVFDSVSPEQYLEERDSIKGLAQEAADGFEKSAVKYREAATKFDQASKLKIHEKLKEYLTAKSQEFTKRAEQADVAKGNPKAFMESASPEALLKSINANKERVEKLEKEAGELAEKSGKIQEENKSIFKPDSK